MDKSFKIRDLRKKDQYKIDDAYLNGYAKLCGVYATAVYNSLSRHADFHTQECFPSIEKIAEQHNISKPSVIKAIKELEKWNIVSVKKEKDTKTKRQLPNIYLLIDKTDWVQKPQSRVNENYSEKEESRVNLTTEPSQSQSKSRVNEVYCKDTHIKDNTIKDTTETSSGDISLIIKSFESINPASKKFYSRPPQREACKELIESYGLEKVLQVIEKGLPKTNGMQFFPTITTPIQLRDKWVSLESAVKKYQAEKEITKNKYKIAF